MLRIDLKENRNKIISAIVTLVLSFVVVIVLILVKHFPPDPPIAERGVEVALGNSDFGFGDNIMPAQSVTTTATQSSSTPSEDNVSTQTTDQTIAIPQKTEKPKQNEAKTQQTPTETKQPEQPKEPEINKNALFPGKTSSTSNNGTTSNSGSSGNTYGSGNMGKPNGNPNSTNYAGSGGSGDVYSLAGRNVVVKNRPSDNKGIEGDIEVIIMVNREGKVVDATIGKVSSASVGPLKAEALAAAKRTTFKADPTAPEVQKGRILYHYVNTK